jgi:hypothetical protein
MRKLIIVFTGMVFSGIIAAFILNAFGYDSKTLVYWALLVTTEIMTGRSLARSLG